jgi:hypothetical protein
MTTPAERLHRKVVNWYYRPIAAGRIDAAKGCNAAESGRSVAFTGRSDLVGSLSSPTCICCDNRSHPWLTSHGSSSTAFQGSTKARSAGLSISQASSRAAAPLALSPSAAR